jgi:hypothetical protein
VFTGGRQRGWARQQDFEAALKVIEAQLSTGPAEYPLYVKALIKRQQGEIQASLQLFQAATVLNPTNLANLKQASQPHRIDYAAAGFEPLERAIRGDGTLDGSLQVSLPRELGVARLNLVTEAVSSTGKLVLMHGRRLVR